MSTEPLPLAAGYTPLFVKGSGSREHLVELYVASHDDQGPVTRRRAETARPETWRLRFIPGPGGAFGVEAWDAAGSKGGDVETLISGCPRAGVGSIDAGWAAELPAGTLRRRLHRAHARHKVGGRSAQGGDRRVAGPQAEDDPLGREDPHHPHRRRLRLPRLPHPAEALRRRPARRAHHPVQACLGVGDAQDQETDGAKYHLALVGGGAADGQPGSSGLGCLLPLRPVLYTRRRCGSNATASAERRSARRTTSTRWTRTELASAGPATTMRPSSARSAITSPDPADHVESRMLGQRDVRFGGQGWENRHPRGRTESRPRPNISTWTRPERSCCSRCSPNARNDGHRHCPERTVLGAEADVHRAAALRGDRGPGDLQRSHRRDRHRQLPLQEDPGEAPQVLTSHVRTGHDTLDAGV